MERHKWKVFHANFYGAATFMTLRSHDMVIETTKIDGNFRIQYMEVR